MVLMTCSTIGYAVNNTAQVDAVMNSVINVVINSAMNLVINAYPQYKHSAFRSRLNNMPHEHVITF